MFFPIIYLFILKEIVEQNDEEIKELQQSLDQNIILKKSNEHLVLEISSLNKRLLESENDFEKTVRAMENEANDNKLEVFFYELIYKSFGFIN